MPRAPRLDIPHLLHHVIIRGIERCDIFRDDEDRARFIDRLGALLRETSTQCYAWSLMRNHVHLLLMPTSEPLSVLMRRLLTGYAVVYNRKYSRSGHLFQNRYKSIICEEEPYFLELVRYIHLNPLRAGAVPSVDDLAEYPWTGHAVVLGNRKFFQDTKAVLDRFDKSSKCARDGYRQFVMDGIPLGRQDKFVGGGLRRSQPDFENEDEIEPFDTRILGGGRFVEHVQEQISDHRLRSIKTPLPELVRRVATKVGLDERDLRWPSKTKSLSEARGVVCYLAVRELGYKGMEVGRLLHLGPTGVTLAVRRGEQAIHQKPELMSCIKA
ncbi:transposase [Geobacter sp. DSM 9736]|uniref:transposase n=1 Tax=Geobacter sp. DSM 9736 TaxID=1277350 RepID=UPI000B509A63|nr:transposase [Geobacter sp. DSM 9736]SNB46953.1 REP element-mobilizing transposase RayT [Geobacter sp. DSM 9736]